MEKYLQYKAADFADDLDFVKWVQSDFVECADKWDSFMNDNPSMGDEISEAIDIIELFQFEEKEVPSAQQDKLLARIHSSIDEAAASEDVAPIKEVQKTTTTKPLHIPSTQVTTEAPSKSILRYLIPLAAAACLGLFAMFNFGGSDNGTDIGNGSVTNSIVTNNTGITEMTNITLPDQSIVNLNASSTLSFDKNNFSKNRDLQLDGEAFFNVEKGQRFVVTTKNGTIEVLGTSFNVFSRDNYFEVECLTGKVKVTQKSGTESMLLTPNESCKLADNKLLKASTNLKESEWTKGIYHFNETPLSAVIGELERQFKVAVVIPSNVENKQYTGAFEKKNLKDALHAITWPLGLEYTINEKLTDGKKGVVIKAAK